MRTTLILTALVASLTIASELRAQSHGDGHPRAHHTHGGDHGANQGPGHGAHQDTAFAALQERGRIGMGVDQYESTHIFDALPDGGRIEFRMNTADPEAARQILAHLHEVAQAFQEGDFSIPGFIHAKDVPGTAVLRAKAERITYTVRELPEGGELRIVTDDPEVVAALREFMAFQRDEHRMGGRAH